MATIYKLSKLPTKDKQPRLKKAPKRKAAPKMAAKKKSNGIDSRTKDTATQTSATSVKDEKTVVTGEVEKVPTVIKESAPADTNNKDNLPLSENFKHELAVYDQLSPLGNLDQYLLSIQSFRVLTPEDEKSLAELFHDQGDLEAARILILSNLRFVAHISRGYSGYGLPLSDIIQEGNIGLMKAVRRFDPTLGVRLISFAVHWIKAEIQEYVIQNWKIVKLSTTKAQRKLFFNLRKSKEGLDNLQPEEASAIAKELNVRTKDVMEMDQRLAANVQVAYSGEVELTTTKDRSVESGSSLELNPQTVVDAEDWEAYRNDKLYELINTLDERSKDIIRKRWMSAKKSTLEELAEKYKVSVERIRQIEVAAMTKLKNGLGELGDLDKFTH